MADPASLSDEEILTGGVYLGGQVYDDFLAANGAGRFDSLKAKAKENADKVADAASQKLEQGMDMAADVTVQTMQVGGTCCTGGSPMGGFEALVDYGNSVYSQAKEKLIRGIATDVASSLKVSTKFAKDAPIKKVVEKLQKVVPDPRKNKNLKKDSAAHIKICKALAASINKRYGSQMVDPDASPAEICKNVGEMMYSMFTGLNTEFLTVAKDIAQSVKNLKALRDYVDATHKAMLNLAGEAGESTRNRANNVNEVYNVLLKEIDRQLAILTNNVNATTGPLTKTLVSLVENNPEFKGLVRDLKVAVGSDVFGDKLGYLLSGTSSVAHAASLIHEALKTLGMSVKDYKNTKTLQEFRSKVYQHLGKKKMNSREMQKMLEAANIIYKTDYDHANIVKYLEGNMSKRGGNSFNSGEFELEEATERELGTGRGYLSRKSVELQMKEQRQYRKMLFKELKKVLRKHFQELIECVNEIARKVGVEIPASDELYRFVVRFSHIDNVDKENIHMALSGYRQDVTSKYEKNQFLAGLKALYQACEPLKSGPMGSKFAQIQKTVARLVSDIDNFNDNFVKTLTEVNVDLTKKPRATGGNYESELRAVTAGATDSDFDYFHTFEKVKKELNYYYSLSHFKSNMGRSAKELESYGEDYENILGDEIAFYVDEINRKYNFDMELAEWRNVSDLTEAEATQQAAQRLRAAQRGGVQVGALINGVAGANDSTKDDILEFYRYVRTYQKKAKIGLFKAAEALDLYMKNFTADMVAHPDDVNDLVNMLNQVNITAKWFTERTGDHLAAVFEACPSGLVANASAWNTGNGSYPKDGSIFKAIDGADHYYEWVRANALAGAGAGRVDGVGNPSIPWYPALDNTDKENVKHLFRRIKKAFRGNRALENLISTFSKLGDKFGGKSLKNSSFMSHSQIYKAINEYLVASSVAMGISDANSNLTVTVGGAIKADGRPNQYLAAGANSDLKKALAITLRSVDPIANAKSAEGGNPAVTGQNNDFSDTDKIFQIMMKSMVSKIMSVVGLFKIFNRPGLSYHSITPLRMIMGAGEVSGGADSFPAVHEDAVELYIRLPLLAEWYREKFSFSRRMTAKRNEADDDYLVSMVPSFDGVWSDFIRLVFVDTEYIKDGSYTTNTLKRLISSINDIYKRYKSSSKVNCREIIGAFVTEINRRYGFIKKREINDYIAESRKHLKLGDNHNEYVDDDRVDFDVMDEEADYGRKPAPSDKFQSVNPRPRRTRKNRVNVHLRNAMNKFRTLVEREMSQYASEYTKDISELQSKFSFVESILQVSQKLRNSKSSKEKFEIVRDSIQGVSSYSALSAEKVLLFHEVVVAPLNVLTMVTCQLDDFRNFALGSNLRTLGKASLLFDGQRGGGGNDHNLLADTLAKFEETLGTLYPHASNDDKNAMRDVMRAYLTTNIRAGEANAANVVSTAIGADPVGFNVANAADAATWRTENNPNRSAWRRFGVNRKALMKDLMNNTFKMGCDLNGLVDIRSSSEGAPVLDYSKLEGLCGVMYNQIKSALESFRNVLPRALLERFERLPSLVPGAPAGAARTAGAKGSLMWVEENLLEKLFKNRDGAGLPEVNASMASTWEDLTREWAFDASNVPVNLAAGAYAPGGPPSRDSFDDVFSELIYWNNAVANGETPYTPDLNDFPSKYLPLFKSGNYEAKTADEKTLESALRKAPFTVAQYDQQLTRIRGMYSTDDFTDAAGNNLGANMATARTGLRNLVQSIQNVYSANAAAAPAERVQTRAGVVGSADAGVVSRARVSARPDHFVAKRLKELSRQMRTILRIDIAAGVSLRDHDAGAGNVIKRGLDSIKDELNSLDSQFRAAVSTNATDRNNAQEVENMKGNVALKFAGNFVDVYMRGQAHKNNPSSFDGVQTGLIPLFNELIARYVSGFADRTQFGKIYLPLIEGFANGNNSSEIMQGNGIQDMNFNAAQFADMLNGATPGLGEPRRNTVLFASLANTIKSMITRVTMPHQTKYHLVTNFMEVPDYMKEIMRANLPVFAKHFEFIKKKAMYLKSFMEGTKRVDLQRTVTAARAAVGPDNLTHGGSLAIGNANSANRASYLLSLLNGLVSSCDSIMRCTDIVQKELSDVALYGEMYQNSLRDFRSRYGKHPLTLLSSMVNLLDHNKSQSNADKAVAPDFLTGSKKFKTIYSTRMLLSQSKVDLNMNFAPGVKDVLQRYDAVAGRTEKAKPFLNDLMLNMVRLIRFLVDSNQYRSASHSTGVLSVSLDGCMDINADVMVYQYARDVDESHALVENNDVERASHPISKHLEPASGDQARNQNRDTLRLYNIMDLNIVPINFHAMMREIPLVNLFNYAYTFDRMVQDDLLAGWSAMNDIAGRADPVVNYDADDNMAINPNRDANSTKHMLAKCLVYPYGVRDRNNEYNTYVRALMTGSTGMKLGRPKFNSDQLWNKVLFEDMYNQTGAPGAPGALSEPIHEQGPGVMQRAIYVHEDRGQLRYPTGTSANGMEVRQVGSRTEVKFVAMPAGHNADDLRAVGYVRYNTHVVRNLEWFVNLQRWLRLNMRETLKWMDTPVVSGHNVLNRKITEYVEHERFDRGDFDGAH